MAYNHEYPYVDPNRYNADWILNKIKELMNEMDTFEALNKITFSGEWDITKQYPAWTVVNDNEGRYGYISIQPVPAGVTIDNADYWRGIANYTDLIADLQNRLIADEALIAANTEAIEKINAKKYIFMSDSYGYHPTVSGSWIAQTVENLGLSASDYYPWYEGSTGFINPGSSGHTFLTLAQSRASAVSAPEDITDVVLCAGTNDAYYAEDYTVSELRTAINDFCVYIRSTYPNAKIHLGMCGNFIGKNTAQCDMLHILPLLYSQAAALHEGVYITGIENIMHAYNLFDDSQHPNVSGAGYIADCVSEHLKGSVAPFVAEDTAPCAGTAGNSVGTNTAFQYYITDETVTIKLTPGAYTLGSPGMTLLNYPLMTFNPRKFGCPDKRKVSVTGFLVNSFTSLIPVEFTFEITDPDSATGGTIYISAATSSINISSGGMNYLTVTIPTMLF